MSRHGNGKHGKIPNRQKETKKKKKDWKNKQRQILNGIPQDVSTFSADLKKITEEDVDQLEFPIYTPYDLTK